MKTPYHFAWLTAALAAPGIAAPPSPAPPPAARAAEAAPANYVLAPNDLVRVSVFQEDDMDWTVRVTRDGTVVLPVVGTVGVAGKTPNDLGAVVRDRLRDGYLVHPQVSVTVQEFSKRRFTILGQVQKAGTIEFPDNATLNLIQAIGMAGGYTSKADTGRVVVKRQVGGQEVVLKLDARRMARDPNTTAFEVLPGDTITIYESMF